MQTSMSTDIHPTAVVDPSAMLDLEVTIGPYCIIGPDVCIGRGTRLEAHVVIDGWTTLGRECHIHTGAILGGAPQDLKFHGEKTFLNIGDRNIIREVVTIHRATGEGNATQIGDDNMIMAYSHIGHNCVVGNGISIANQAGVSGHVLIEDRVVIGGMVGIHQYVRIGKLAFVGGFSKVVKDVPPFMQVDGRPTEVVGLNVIGLRRAGMGARVRAGLQYAHRLLYRSNLNLAQAIASIESEVEPSEERDYLLDFLNSTRRGHGGRGNDPTRRRASSGGTEAELSLSSEGALRHADGSEADANPLLHGAVGELEGLGD
jgi:UDP-N-acetylglucosamine acyltransferase